jgi:hypothetical protein
LGLSRRHFSPENTANRLIPRGPAAAGIFILRCLPQAGVQLLCRDTWRINTLTHRVTHRLDRTRALRIG